MKPTVIKLSKDTYIRTNNEVFHQADGDGYSELGGAKHQQKKAAAQHAKDVRKAEHRKAVDTRKQTHKADKEIKKTTHTAGKSGRKLMKKGTRVQKHDMGFQHRVNKKVTKQNLANAQQALEDENDLLKQQNQSAAEDQSENSASEDTQDQYTEDTQGQDAGYDDSASADQEDGSEEEYEGDYEDETEDPQSESFSGFVDDFDKAHYEMTGKRANKKMRAPGKKKMKVRPTFIAKDKIKQVSCPGYNRIDLSASSFDGANPINTSLIALGLLVVTGIIIYKYAK